MARTPYQEGAKGGGGTGATLDLYVPQLGENSGVKREPRSPAGT